MSTSANENKWKKEGKKHTHTPLIVTVIMAKNILCPFYSDSQFNFLISVMHWLLIAILPIPNVGAKKKNSQWFRAHHESWHTYWAKSYGHCRNYALYWRRNRATPRILVSEQKCNATQEMNQKTNTKEWTKTESSAFLFTITNDNHKYFLFHRGVRANTPMDIRCMPVPFTRHGDHSLPSSVVHSFRILCAISPFIFGRNLSATVICLTPILLNVNNLQEFSRCPFAGTTHRWTEREKKKKNERRNSRALHHKWNRNEIHRPNGWDFATTVK